MREPYFWSAGLDPQSRESAPLTRFLLTPLAWLYAAVTARRLRRVQPSKVSAAVICVGNVSAGGTGKSPVVAYIRAYLSQTNTHRAASLSRGYGGRLKGPLRVLEDTHSAAEVGDEPLMLAQTGESWIGADRAQAGAAMAADGVDVIIMDDGHQNPGLAKDLSLVVVDSRAAFGNGYVIPKGPLREPIAAGLARADAVIVIGPGPLPGALQATSLPIFRARLEAKETPPPHAYVAFAGIGRPEKFFASLEAVGTTVCDAVPFPDHHRFSANDLSYLRQLASDNDAHLITTTKDYVRLPPDQRQDILTFPVEILFEKPDMFHDMIDRVTGTAPK